MHELAVAEGIANVVEARAVALSATRVKMVRLRIGEASGVVVDSLTFCFEMIARLNPLLESASLSIDHVPHMAWCAVCEREFAVRDFIAQCPECGVWSDKVISGTELQVLEMEIETREETG